MTILAVDTKTNEALEFEILGWDVERVFMKADEPEGPQDRWISVGDDGNKHPVLLRPVKGSEGTYRVVGGAGGRMNGLRLHNVKSPEAYRKESLARAKDRRAAERAENTKLTPEERQQRLVEKQQSQAGRREAERQFAATVIGPEPEIEFPDGASPEDVKKIVSTAHRERLKQALKVARDAEKKVLLDAELRVSSGLATSYPKTQGALGMLNVDEIVTQKGIAKGPGYQRPLAEEAEKNGLTADALAAAVQDIRERSALEAGKPLPPKGTPPGAAIQTAGAEAFGTNQQAQTQIKQLQQAQTEAIRKAIAESVEANTQLGDVLKARAALRDAYREAAAKATGRVFEPGFQMTFGEPDLDQIVDTLEDQYLTGHVQAFLDEVEREHPAEEFLDLTDAQSEEGLHATRGAAAFDALHEVALATLGQGAINRDAVEVLGPEGAAQVMARALRQAFTPEDQKQILAALEEHHVEDQKVSLPAATKEAADLREKAHGIELELATTSKDLAVAAELTHNKLEILKEARRVLGGTLGRLEARAALIQALKQAPQDSLTVPMGRMTPQRAVQTAAALGLKQGEYRIDHAMGEATMTLQGEGQDRLIAPVDQAGRGEREIAMAIKKGQLDEEGYLPAGFSQRTGSRFDNPLMEPRALQTKLDLHEGTSPQELKSLVRQHIGSRLAEGQRQSDVWDDLRYGNTAHNLGPEATAQVENVLDGISEESESGDYQTQLVKEFMEAHGIPGDATFHGQAVGFDHPDFREAMHRTLAEDPRTRAAHLPDGELSTAHEADLRDFYLKDVAKVEPGAEVDPEGKAEKLAALGPEPEQFDLSGTPMDDLGMDPQPSPAWKAWDAKRRQIEREHDAGARTWKQLVDSSSGLKGAYAAVRGHMAGAFAERFAKHYQDVTGTKLRLGDMDGRTGLGMTLEGQIRAAMPDASKPFEGMSKGVKLAKGISMSGQYRDQQRAVKAIKHLKRMGLHYAAGSGKTPIMLGALTEIHASRLQKGQPTKAVLAVPSIVQAQFASEAAKFIDPTSGFRVHARPGETFEQRLAAYKDPEKHAIVVTHQALRDDTVKILAKHRGETHEQARDFMMKASKADVAKAVKAAFQAEGIDFHAVMVDEAHDIVDRKGKETSSLTKAIDAHAHGSEYFVGASGDPVKNDASEAWSWLNRIDPVRYPESSQDEFMRRYGVDTPLTRRAMKMELTRYFWPARVDPGVSADMPDHTVQLEASQNNAIQDVERAAAKLRTGDPDVTKWAKVLAPEAFDGKDETQHAEIAERVKKANGTYREQALDKIINVHPEGAKIKKAVELVKGHLGKGEPVVIFARRLEAVKQIHAAMEAEGIKAVSITGSDSATEKGAKIGKFQGAGGKPEADVIILSDAGATGANLQRGKALIHMDQPYTFKTHNQRSARIWRIGQDRDVTIHNILADHEFDRKARERVKRKSILASIYADPVEGLDDVGYASTLRKIKARANQGEIQAVA